MLKMINSSSLICNTEHMKQLMCNLGQQSITKIINDEEQAIPTQYLHSENTLFDNARCP